jgi:hypothetical protein
MMFKARYLGRAALVLMALAVVGWMVMMLWNAVLPSVIAEARPIDYLHAVGLLILSRILFGGFRGHGAWHGRRHWARWQAMTAEEREQFRQNMRPGPRACHRE